MTSQVKYYALSYEDLANYIILREANVPFEGIMELIHRGPSKTDYLLKYIQDNSYWFLDLFEDRIVPVTGIGILTSLKRRDLFDDILPYLSKSYDLLINVFEQFTLTILSDLLPEDISKVKARLTNESLHKLLLSDFIEAYGLMTGRGIVSKPVLVEFVK